MTTQNLIYLLDRVVTGYTPIALEIISFISIILAISVILIKNPISSILCLIGLFFNIACYLCILGLTFLGLSYLLVYVGAISILFLFILMLINIRVSELTVNTTNSIPLVIIVSVYFIFTMNEILPGDSLYSLGYNYMNMVPLLGYFVNFVNNFDIVNVTENEVYYSSSNSWDSNIAEATHITSIGNIMYTSYFIWLILTSIILLLAMVGCIVITLK